MPAGADGAVGGEEPDVRVVTEGHGADGDLAGVGADVHGGDGLRRERAALRGGGGDAGGGGGAGDLSGAEGKLGVGGGGEEEGEKEGGGEQEKESESVQRSAACRTTRGRRVRGECGIHWELRLQVDVSAA